MKRFEDMVAVVVGGTSGIGYATANRLIAEGALAVYLVGRDASKGAQSAASAGERAVFIQADATRRGDLDDVIARVQQDHGRLDVLVNAQGMVLTRPFQQTRSDHFDTIVAANLESTFNSCQAALSLLVQTAAATGLNTAIVNVSSVNGLRGDKGLAIYSAAKAGVIGLSKSLALELIGSGVRVNCVAPGAVATAMTEATAGVAERAAAYHKAIPAGRFARPEEIAAAIAFVASEDASFMVGAHLVVDGGLAARTGHPDLLEMFAME